MTPGATVLANRPFAFGHAGLDSATAAMEDWLDSTIR
jgi:hypothetical protein